MKFAYIIVVFVSLVSIAYGGFSGAIFSGFRYDSNICKLSDYDLARFSTGEKDFLLDTSDDGIIRTGTILKWKNRISGINLDGSGMIIHNIYISNGYKDYLYCAFDFAVRRKNTRLKISGTYIPKYASRAYLDDDTDSTKWASYWSSTAKIELRQRTFFGIYIGGKYEYRFARYNDYFPEYDSQRNAFGIFAAKYVPFKSEIGYYFYTSDARGYDRDGESKETSDESDISYEQDKFYTSLGYDSKIHSIQTEFDLDFAIFHRVYVSTKPYSTDPLHLGRDENVFSIKPAAKIFITDNLWTKTSAEYFQRDARSEYNPDIPKLRDYNRMRTTITLGWNF